MAVTSPLALLPDFIFGEWGVMSELTMTLKVSLRASIKGFENLT
jgi:hypothetical protein